MTMAILGSALFFVAAPSVVAGLIPWWITGWEFLPPFFDLQATRAVGILLIVGGLPGLVDSFARFALQGLGVIAMEVVRPGLGCEVVNVTTQPFSQEPRMDVHENARTTPHSRMLIVVRLCKVSLSS
jgi:hypothetical protein